MTISENFISNSVNRLDVAIYDYLEKKLSRTQVQKFIQEQGVVVSGEMVYKHGYKINLGSQIELSWLENIQELDLDLVSKIETVIEAVHYLIIKKPPGLVVHSGAGHQGDTLADWLVEKYPEQSQMQGGDPEDVHENPHLGGGMVHRLDKDTQGLMLIARDFETLRFFQEQFKSREVKKKYLAILDGKLEFKTKLKGFQIRTRRNVLKQFFTLENIEDQVIAEKISKNIPLKGDWRTSESDFTPLYYNSELNQTIAEVQIFTGRMHQIRTQAEFLGFPIFQDPLYKVLNDVNLTDLAQKYHQRIGLEKTEIKHLSELEFKTKIHSIFDFDQRTSFFLKAYSLEILLPDGKIGKFEC